MEAAVLPDLNLKEASWVQSIADTQTNPQIGGIVAYAPLENGRAVESTIGQLAAQVPILKGVRRILNLSPNFPPQDDFSDPCWFLNTSFATGLEVLHEHGLHFELLTRAPSQFQCALDLVATAPENLTIIMQHLGNPNMSNPLEMAEWVTYVQQLSKHSNVAAKISGVPERADVAPLPSGYDTWTEDEVRPYVRAVIDAFGYDRVIFGGNWFVVKQYSTYTRWARVLLGILQGVDKSSLKKLFFDNAQKFYRL